MRVQVLDQRFGSMFLTKVGTISLNRCRIFGSTDKNPHRERLSVAGTIGSVFTLSAFHRSSGRPLNVCCARGCAEEKVRHLLDGLTGLKVRDPFITYIRATSARDIRKRHPQETHRSALVFLVKHCSDVAETDRDLIPNN